LYSHPIALVDLIVVSFNSRRHLRQCVAPLADREDVHVIVVDNASSDGSLEVLEDLPVETIALAHNGGFAVGCNAGWRAGEAPFVLFMNPDATIDDASLNRLVRVLKDSESVGAAGPRILDADGSLDFSQRRFPRLRSTYAQALFLHRLFPRALWADEVIRDERRYRRAGPVEWLSGACLLVRRTALEQIDGWDAGFFFYSEDVDLCRRLWDAGYEVRFEPAAVCRHSGGASAPRSGLLPVLAASRLRYARKHDRPVVAELQRIGIALNALTHGLLSQRGAEMRAGYRQALREVWLPSRSTPD
jgi:N-acetylglucosaminyl-diphospho-decaprenol L-rhamnosyltransferase